MAENIRRIVCWNCKKTFRVDVGEIVNEVVVVYRGRKKQEQTPTTRLIIQCPHCDKENEITV
jgi:Fe-S-cluster-containing dehydrogenase component